MGKTPFQKHREEEEKKKKRAEAEAAKLYEDFVESFGEGDNEEKSFVKGETIQPGSSQPAQNSGSGGPGGSRKGSSKYVPSFIPPMMAAALSKKEDGGRRSDESVFPLPSSGRGDRGKPRNIDKMLETMKREQDERAERQRLRRERGSSFGDPGSAVDDGLGSFDDGDPFTTNLYVGNLATTVDEEVLKREFLRYGDIASIKVMWPRDDDQRRRARNCGFVAYMTRQGAEKAKAELNGVLLHDLDLKIGWGKAVVLPPIPVYTQSGVGGLGPMLAAAKAKAMSAHAPPGQHAPAPWKVPEPEPDPQSGVGPDLVVKVPEDARARFIVDSVACYVLLDGCAFEQVLMTREANNPEFAFLFDLASPDHLYYRWRLYSLSQGDSLRNWRNEPFVMVEGGPRWIPPPLTAAASTSHQTAAQRGGEAKDKDTPLSDLQRDRFEDLLRALTMERSKICEAMVFAIDNADSAAEVVEILSDSLTLSETPMTTKVARLMLASDVLHNSTAPVRNASRYRGLLEACLPDVFESMQETYTSLESRMKQEVLRRNVLRVLRIWRSWCIFSDDFLNGLQATFLKGGAEVGPNPVLREELDSLDPEALALRCRRNGLSRQGDREAMTQRLVSLQAYLHGEMPADSQVVRRPKVEEALPTGLADGSQGIFAVNNPPPDEVEGGAATGAAPASVLGPVAPPPKEEKKKEVKTVEGPVSKWTLVDYDDESAALDRPEEEADIFQDLASTPVVESGMPASPGPAAGSSPEPDALAATPPAEAEAPESRTGGERMDAAEEGRRARLRQVEVELLMLREELEDKGLEKAQVEAQVEEQRAKLLSSAGQASEADAEKATPAADKPSTSSRERKEKAKLESRSSKEEGQKTSKRARSRERSLERSRARSQERGKGGSKRPRSRDRSQETSRARSPERSRRERSRSRSADDRSRRSRRGEGTSGRDEGRERGRDEGSDRRDGRDARRRSRSPSRERRRSRSRDRSRSRGAADRDRGGRGRSHSRDRAKDDKHSRKRERSSSREKLESKTSKKSSKEVSAKGKKESKKEKARSRSPKKSKKEHSKRK